MLQQNNETKPSTQPKAEPTSQYVETIRDGAIGANIFLAQRKDGSQGHYFKLSRSYKGENQEEFKYSEQFYARNGQAIAKVASEAAQKCETLDKQITK